MKAFLQLFAIALLMVSAVAATAQTPTEPGDRLPQTSATTAQETPIPVLLPIPPTLANIKPRRGASMTGQLTGFTPQNVTLSSDNFSQAIAIAEIERVEYSDRELFISVSGTQRKMRGEDTGTDTDTWEGVPVSALELTDPATGNALLRLGSVVSPLTLLDYLDISKTSIYVVKEIVFETPETMTIRVTKIDR